MEHPPSHHHPHHTCHHCNAPARIYPDGSRVRCTSCGNDPLTAVVVALAA